ncbi:major capsid protein [Marinicauda sp. Alg238-R41]|uniref:major capsid protein n=1 Tax=Marinicauda sp. Alg238-R41 TaxID=2993447 RepID=UPI0022E7B676|nr:major capsid protein [Marinicauda sp. Alg238-R41]
MALNLTGRETHEIVAVVEQFARPRSFLLDTFFPQISESDDQYVDIEEVVRGKYMAPIVHEDHPGRDVKTGGFNTSRFEPALVKPLESVKPKRAFKRMAGEQAGGIMTPAERFQLTILDILQEQRKSIIRRKEWQASSALRNGSLTLNGEGYEKPITVDYQRPSNLTLALLADNQWGDDGVDPAQDLENWMLTLQQESGYGVTDVVFDPKAWWKARPAFKDALDNRRQDGGKLQLGPVNVGDDVSQARFLGDIGDLRFWVYQEWYDDAQGVQQIMPDNTVILGSAAIEGIQAQGAIADDAVGFLPLEYAPNVYRENNPPKTFCMTQSKPLVIPARANASMCVTVA